jgi:hypothetical protein
MTTIEKLCSASQDIKLELFTGALKEEHFV